MTISASLKPLDLRDELEAANMKGKNLTFLDDYSKEELGQMCIRDRYGTPGYRRHRPR